MTSIKRHYIHQATKNAAVALNMAQQVWDSGDCNTPAVQELVQLINSASLALQRICDRGCYVEVEYEVEEVKDEEG